jgi:hypothetical protein
MTLQRCAGLAPFDLQLVVDLVYSGDLLGFRLDYLFLAGILHRASECDDPIDRDNLDVLGCGRERVVSHDRLPNLLGQGPIGLTLRLIPWRERGTAAVPDVTARIIGGRLCRRG